MDSEDGQILGTTSTTWKQFVLGDLTTTFHQSKFQSVDTTLLVAAFGRRGISVKHQRDNFHIEWSLSYDI